MASTDNWVDVIHKHTVLNYVWIPDANFVDRNLMHLQFPTYERQDHDDHFYLTEFAQVQTEKWAHRDLEKAAPRVWGMGNKMNLSAEKLMEHLTYQQRNRLSGTEAACRFLRTERSLWEDWVPSVVDCQVGQGLQSSRQHGYSCDWCDRATYSREGLYHGDNKTRTRYCRECEPGRFQDLTQSSQCQLCLPGSFAAVHRSSECLQCPYGYFAFAEGSAACAPCPPGRITHRLGADSPNECEACVAGRFVLEQMTQCEACPAGTFAAASGSTGCSDCPILAWSREGSAMCDPNLGFLFAYFFWCLAIFIGVHVAYSSIFYRAPIVDLTSQNCDDPAFVKVEGARCVLKLACCHWLLPFGGVVPVHFTGTGNLRVDDCRNKFFAQGLSSNSVLIVDYSGKPFEAERSQLETSIGILHLSPCAAIWRVGFLRVMPSSVVSLAAISLCVFLHIRLPTFVESSGSDYLGSLCQVRSPLVICSMAFFSSLLAVIVVERSLQKAARNTPMSKLQTSWQQQNAIENPNPEECERGAARAVTAAQLMSLNDFFGSFIGDRNMYYVCSNLVMPLTKPHQLSFAELIGPSMVMWYCSHFWGTPFRDSCACLRLHARSEAFHVENSSPSHRNVSGVTHASRECLAKTSYWVCTVSNNQWRIKEEVGRSVEDTSFFVCLRSGHVKGTCILMDNEAKSLKRAWCLFEVLQTIQLQKSGPENLTGLWICTSR
eukprot:TRINITY_DN12357_c0_g1_i1.p1 TRINITY_DN12357_c0_g1~~TRINITY_DN12357_c0_g1_i1.p1  ORF type:complete len:794 (-),score=64.90 TRINITY_DN12357_c0_g1_i1:419-2569(-)